MTACIVGWAHTAFGKRDTETVESLIVRVTQEALEHAGHRARGRRRGRARPFQRRLLAAGLHGLPGVPGERRVPVQARRPGSRMPAPPGSAAVHQAIKTIEAKRARTVLVVGVEQMTKTPGPEIGRNLLKASYLPEDGETPGGFAGVFGKIAGLLFPALRRPVRRARHDRRQEPQERRRQSLCADAQGSRLRVLPAGIGQESLRRRAPEAHRLLARLGRRRGHRDRRYRDGLAHEAGGRLPGDGARAGFPADVEARHRSSSRAAPRHGSRRSTQPASRSATSPSSRPMTASRSPNSSSTRPWA